MDARIICATNRDLDAMVSEGQFREDLFYRINTITIRVPPLRERHGRHPAPCEHFLAPASRRLGKGVRGFADDARRRSGPTRGRERARAAEHHRAGHRALLRGALSAGEPASGDARSQRQETAACGRTAVEQMEKTLLIEVAAQARREHLRGRARAWHLPGHAAVPRSGSTACAAG